MKQELDWEKYPPLIVTAALTGAVVSKEKYPLLPITPSEIARDALACEAAGASIVHLHMRAQFGEPTQDGDRFAETIQLIRQQSPRLIVCATTTSRGSSSVSDRIAALQLAPPDLPDMASLTLGSYNTPTGINRNPPDEILEILAAATSVGVLPEIEIFELGMIGTLSRLRQRELIPPNAPVNILVGVEGALDATAQNLVNAVTALPEHMTWLGAGIGKFQNSANALAIAMGGGVRVGMEDDPRGSHENWSNVDAVKRAVKISKAFGRAISTPLMTRKMLGLGNTQ